MKYNYVILGRTEGTAKATEYTGTVEAKTPKEGLLKALADTFGDPRIKNPIKSLTDWVDDETDFGQWQTLDDDAENFCFCTSEFTFDVEVEEAD